MTIVRLSGANVISVEENGLPLEVRQYHKDFQGDGPLLADTDGMYEITHPRGRAEAAYLQESAGLLYQLGCILCDRREPSPEEEPLIWEYLYENRQPLYDRLGRVIDDIETEIFG